LVHDCFLNFYCVQLAALKNTVHFRVSVFVFSSQNISTV